MKLRAYMQKSYKCWEDSFIFRSTNTWN